ncbi:MbnP family protein [Faecalibacter sp. LW9]|uniref:MbnP family protein n=1 Tax=Faecalibacter sp. LW9 TaxID=3103144 RepID=UPI002AFFE273|nr:MbnP family protein [Faecalibacter sp. LW9]
MNTLNKYITSLFLILVLILSSCSSDDDNSTIVDPSAKGNIQLKFENGFNNLGGIVLNQTTQTSSSGQKHQFSNLQYVISNITLIDEQGNSFDYHKNNPDLGAFIIDQSKAVGNVNYINLTDVPQGKYTKVKFGLGISQDAYLLGQTGQAIFWDKAKDSGLTWSWAAGYIFVKLEGFYGTNELNTPFKNHTGNMGNVNANNTANLYREITLNLPSTARVTGSIKPSIHIIADFNQYLSGSKSLELNDSNHNAMGSSVFLQEVTDNLINMFRVDHVHNN